MSLRFACSWLRQCARRPPFTPSHGGLRLSRTLRYSKVFPIRPKYCSSQRFGVCTSILAFAALKPLTGKTLTCSTTPGH